jgi:HD-GYP domain-containing protein (c-di-GMP phosphodiesterase class II)
MQLANDIQNYQKNKVAQPIVDDPDKPLKIPVSLLKKQELIKTRLDLLDKICGNTRSVKQQVAVYTTILEMARYALNASATSMTLLGETRQSMVYRFTDGPLGRQVVKIASQQQLGLASLVVQSGKSLKINAVDEDARFGRFKEEAAGVMVRSAICVPLVINNKSIGVLEAFNRLDGNDFSDSDLSTMDGMAAGATLTIQNVKLNESQLYSYQGRLQRLVANQDPKEIAECTHARRVVDYSLIAAKELGLPPEEQEIIEYGATLHDVGMLGVPLEITQKKEKLSNDDWNVIRRHPVMGYNLLRGMSSLNQVGKIILYHHERYDGKGYPSGLKGESIPLNAQIISVAEAFDAMTVKHAYRDAMTPQQAMKELGQVSGTQFNPDAVKALCMGHIRSRSLNKIKAKDPVEKIDYIKKQQEEANTWKINFGKSARVKVAEKTGEPDETE